MDIEEGGGGGGGGDVEARVWWKSGGRGMGEGVGGKGKEAGRKIPLFWTRMAAFP